MKFYALKFTYKIPGESHASVKNFALKICAF